MDDHFSNYHPQTTIELHRKDGEVWEVRRVTGCRLSAWDRNLSLIHIYCLLQWFQQDRAAGIPIRGPVLCEKTNELAARFGVEDFHASTG